MKSDTFFLRLPRRSVELVLISEPTRELGVRCGGGGGVCAWENSCHTDYMGPAPMEEIIFFQVGISRA